MFFVSALLAFAPQSSVDLDLIPGDVCVAAGNVVELTLVLSTQGSNAITAVDALLSWDPTKLSFLDATSLGPWFLAGFLNDPDGINASLVDGDGLYTMLASPASPALLPPSLQAASFRFLAIASGEVTMPAALGTFGETQVFGLVAGQTVTGNLSSPAAVGVVNAAASETSRLGVPPNADVLRPGLTSGPVLGETWDPVIDHASFMPSAVLDGLALTVFATNIPFAPNGTALCLPPLITKPLLSFPGVPFQLPLPTKCGLVGASLCSQGFSLDATGFFVLTNALDITLGTF